MYELKLKHECALSMFDINLMLRKITLKINNGI